jgi:hypothetical protein
MNNCCICCFSRIFLLGILIFKGLTARRLYKLFGVKGLTLRLMYARFQNAFMHYTAAGYLVQYALRQVRNADFVPCSSHRFCAEQTERYGYQH